VFNFW